MVSIKYLVRGGERILKLAPPFRLAKPEDAIEIARLLDLAADGIVEFIWSSETSPGQSPFEFGAQEVRQSDTWCTYQNAIVVQQEDQIAALMLGFPLLEKMHDPNASNVVPAVLKPFIELEAIAVGSFFIDSLAVKAQYRKRGHAYRLLQLSEQKAGDLGYSDLSLQVFEENQTALDLYRRYGFKEIARRPVVTHTCHPRTGDILLMTKPVSS